MEKETRQEEKIRKINEFVEWKIVLPIFLAFITSLLTSWLVSMLLMK